MALIHSIKPVLFALLVCVSAALCLTSPTAAKAQSVGPSGCVMYCDEPSGSGRGSGRDGGGGGGGGARYDPYSEMAAGAFGAFMNGFMSQLQEDAAKRNDPLWQATELNNEGVRLANAGRNGEAIRYYEQALSLDPGNYVFQRNLDWANDNYKHQLRRQEEQERREQTAGRIKDSFGTMRDTVTGGGERLELMDLDDTGVDDAESRIGTVLQNITGELLDAPAGQSAWDGGYGGTLDGASARAVAGDYDGALEQLAAARKADPNIPALDETEAYVKGLKAAKSPEVAARLAQSPSPKAEIILDSLDAGKGDWTASLRYLEGMRLNSGNDPHVGDALSYVRGLYAYQKVRGDPMPKPSAPMIRSAKAPPAPQANPEQALNNKLDHLLSGNTSSADKDEPILRPDHDGLRTWAMETDRMLRDMKSKDLRLRAEQAFDALNSGDLKEAAATLYALHIDYPENGVIRSAMYYVEGMYEAQRRSQ